MILVTAATRFALLLAPHVWRKRDRPRARPELAENCCQRATPRKTLGPAPTRCWTAVCYEGVNDGCENLRPSWNNPLRSNGASRRAAICRYVAGFGDAIAVQRSQRRSRGQQCTS